MSEAAAMLAVFVFGLGGFLLYLAVRAEGCRETMTRVDAERVARRDRDDDPPRRRR